MEEKLIDGCCVCDIEQDTGYEWEGKTYCSICWMLNCVEQSRPVTQANLSRAVRLLLERPLWGSSSKESA